MKNKALYSFNFIPEGFNAVWADTKEEAIKQARKEFPSLANQIDLKSFVRRDTNALKDAYWNNLPLMD